MSLPATWVNGRPECLNTLQPVIGIEFKRGGQIAAIEYLETDEIDALDACAGLPDRRKGQCRDGKYSMADIGLSAFSVFFMGSPSPARSNSEALKRREHAFGLDRFEEHRIECRGRGAVEHQADVGIARDGDHAEQGLTVGPALPFLQPAGARGTQAAA
jgi:hypothetical protein